MKRFLALAVVVSIMLLAGIALAGTAKDNTGCGLGTAIWNSGADGSSVSQSLQATTNGTFGNQTFGITSGTSECKQPSKFVNNEKVREFVASNLDNLAKEIAMGRGETLETLAELMEISTPKKQVFYTKMQSDFSKIFASNKVEYADVVDSIAVAYSQI